MAPAKIPAHGEKGSYFDDYTKLSNGKVNTFDGNTFNIWNYLRVEMFGIGEPGTLEPPNQAHIQNFFMVPMNLESLMCLGFFICLDAFLYVITYLPIRVVFSLCLLCARLQSYIFNIQLGSILPFLFPPSKSTSTITYHRTQTYDIMRGAMFVVGCIALRQINMSQIYHFIRGQSMIKLYVLTSMLEIVDKLLCSFGQDAFDALHWHTRFNPRSVQMVLTFLMVTGYVSLHSAVYFLHVATLTVVINSVDSALITVLILNNFAELKSFVLKKFDCNNLFQLACSDITERFQMFLFLSLILIVAVAQAGPTWPETLLSFSKIGLMMFVSEVFADWFKHAFINKFNMINASVYQDFAYVLRNDILSNQKDEVILDHTYSVTRRLGLSQIPLGCVCFRYLHLAYATPAVQAYAQELSVPALLLRGGAVFVALVLLKIVIGVGLVFYAAGAHKRDAAVFLRTPAMAKNNEKISSGSGTGTFHNTVNVAPAGAGPLLGAPLSRQNSLLHDPCAEDHPKMSLSAVGIAGIAVSPCEVARSDVYDTPSHHSQHGNYQAFTPHTPHYPSMQTPVQQTRPHSHSITNPFTEIHVSTEEVRRVVAAVGVDGAEEFIESQVENQQLYVGDGVHIVPMEPSQAEAEQPEVPPSEAATDSDGPLHIHTSPTARSVAGQSQTAPRTRPPLGRLNLGVGAGSSNYSTAEHATDLFEHIVSPPMSPMNRSAAGSIVGDGCSHMHTPGPSATTTTSTPIVQLDAHAFNQHKLNTAPFVSRPHQNSIHGHPRGDEGEHSDNEDTRSNMSDVSRNTTLEEAEAQRMKERLEFMEELSSIERYTVYKGRIL